MVKLCYLLAATCASIPATNAISTEYVRLNKKQVVLGTENTEFLTPESFSFAPGVRSRLVKRGNRGVKANMDFGVHLVDDDANQESVDEEEDDDNDDDEKETLINSQSYKPEDVEESNEEIIVSDELPVNSYAFKKLQKKLGIKDKGFEMPVSGPVPDWDDQFYDNDGKPVVYQVDTEELKDMLDHYLDMGKEKWAGFLATSNCNKFQKLLNKLKKKINDDCDEESEPIKKPDTDCDDEKETEKDKNLKSKLKDKIDEKKELIKHDDETPNFGKNVEKKPIEKKPVFSNLPEDELNSFQNMLTDVISYWEQEDAKKILESSNGLSYKEFELDGDDFDIVKQFKHDKQKNKKKFSAYNVGSTYDSNYDSYITEDDNDIENPEGSEYYETPEIDEYTKNNPKHQDLLESIAPEIVKTKKQKDWLKENALRRAKIIQALLNGELDETTLRQDIIRYRESNIFLEEDQNEFINNGFRLQSTSMAMYILFVTEALMFQLF